MSIRPILASLCLTLLLAACGTLTPAPTPTPPATSTPPPTVTPTFDPAPLLQADPYPGTDLGLQPEAAYALPDEVQAKLREMGAIPILANNLAGSVKDGLCRLPMPAQLVSGAQVNTEAAARSDAAPFALPDGQVEQVGIWQLPIAGDWQCVAFVAGLDNQLGLEPGTVGVLFFSGGGKAGVEILNLDNPLRVFVKSPNRADVRLEDGRLVFKTLGPDGKVIEEQTVEFLTEEEIALRNMPDLVLNADRYDFESLPVVDWEDLANGRFWQKLVQMVESGKVPIPPLRPLTAEEVAAYIELTPDGAMDGFVGAFWFNEDFYTKGNLDLRILANRPSFCPAPYRTQIDGEWFRVEPNVWLNWDGSFGGFVGVYRESNIRKTSIPDEFIKDISQTNEGYFTQPALISPKYADICLKFTAKSFCDLYYANHPRIKELMLEFKQTGIMPKELGRYPVKATIQKLWYELY